MKRTPLLIALVISNQCAFAGDSNWREALTDGNRRMLVRSYDEAKECFERAVRDVKNDSAATADDKVLCLESLANVLQIEDVTQEAIPKYEKSLRLLKKAHGQYCAESLSTLETLARIYYLDGQYQQSVAYLNNALTVIHKNDLGDSFAFARVARAMGQALAQTHIIGQTETWYDQSLTAAMSLNQLPDDTFLEGLLSDYIDIAQKADESKHILSSAMQKELLKDSIESYSRTKSVDTSQWNKAVSVSVIDPASGKPSPAATLPSPSADASSSQFDRMLATNDSSSSSTESQAKSSQPLDMTAKSPLSTVPNKDVTLARINKQREEFYERMIATDLDSLGANHPSTARDLTGLAYIYISEKRFSEAKPLLERALSIYKSAYGADPIMVKRAETMLSAIDSESNVLFEDSSNVKEVLASVQPVPVDAQKMDVALRLNYLALLYYSAGKLDQAAKIYAWALPATANACGERSALTASCLFDYARLLRSTNNVELAKKYESASTFINQRNAAKQAALSMP